MNEKTFSNPLPLNRVTITDGFWKKEMELVRKEVIPYQWNALNDQVPGAEPSYCMHNFKTAVKLNQTRKAAGSAWVEPAYTERGFAVTPEDPKNPDDKFYGFVFQDTDFHKWIEAVGYSLSQTPDPALEALADEAIDIVCAAQQEDGYLDTYYILNGKDKIFSNLRDYHELYCLGHLIEGAVAYYQATGKRKLLEAAARFADYCADYFGPEEGKCKGYPGHEIAEMALIRLYEVTGEERYLNLSRFFIDERGKRPYYFDTEHPEAIDKNNPDALRYAYHQAQMPVREMDTVSGHSVRAVYLYSGMASVAKETKDDALFAACERLWNNMVDKNMYVTGGIGSTNLGEAFTFDYDLPNALAYAETCASIGTVFWARRMLEISPDARYANIMERELYNGALSGMALDGKRFFYVNPLEVNPRSCHEDARKFHVKSVRQKWFGCACCPPNIARLISSIGSYACTENEDTLFVHLYIGGTYEKQLKDESIAVGITSGLPFDGHVEIRAQETTAPFTLALRIPDWCDSFTLGGDTTGASGEKGSWSSTFDLPCSDLTEAGEGAALRMEKGYLYITRTWKEDDVLTLDFPMEVTFLQSNELVQDAFGKVALSRGPVVYCLEEFDNGKNLHLLSVDLEGEITEEETLLFGKDNADSTVPAAGEKIIALMVPGSRTALSKPAVGAPYTVYEKPKTVPVTLRFIPYYTWANRGENEMRVWVKI